MELTLKSQCKSLYPVSENLKQKKDPKTQPPEIHTHVLHFMNEGRHSGKWAHSLLARVNH